MRKEKISPRKEKSRVNCNSVSLMHLSVDMAAFLSLVCCHCHPFIICSCIVAWMCLIVVLSSSIHHCGHVVAVVMSLLSLLNLSLLCVLTELLNSSMASGDIEVMSWNLCSLAVTVRCKTVAMSNLKPGHKVPCNQL